jgi:hypothetical protein
MFLPVLKVNNVHGDLCRIRREAFRRVPGRALCFPQPGIASSAGRESTTVLQKLLIFRLSARGLNKNGSAVATGPGS